VGLQEIKKGKGVGDDVLSARRRPGDIRHRRNRLEEEPASKGSAQQDAGVNGLKITQRWERGLGGIVVKDSPQGQGDIKAYGIRREFQSVVGVREGLNESPLREGSAVGGYDLRGKGEEIAHVYFGVK